MAIKIIHSSEGKLECTFTMPNGKLMGVVISESPEEGVCISPVGDAHGAGVWFDTLPCTEEYGDNEFFKDFEKNPHVHVYGNKDVDADGRELEGCPVSFRFKEEKVINYADDSGRFERRL